MFLDTNVASYLIDWHQGDPGPMRERLLAAKARSMIQVLGSLEVLAELAGMFRARPGLFRKTINFQIEVIGQHWILPLIERFCAEVLHDGSLDSVALQLQRGQRRRLERILSSDRKIRALADDVHAHALAYKRDTEALRIEMIDRLEEARHEVTRAALSRQYREWWENVDTAEWCRGMLDDGVTSGRIPPRVGGWPDPRKTSPSLWHHMRYRLARIALEVGDQQRIDASDEYDARHYSAAAAYADVLVTEDRRFASVCAMIGDGKLQVLGMEQFDELLKNSLRESPS